MDSIESILCRHGRHYNVRTQWYVGSELHGGSSSPGLQGLAQGNDLWNTGLPPTPAPLASRGLLGSPPPSYATVGFHPPHGGLTFSQAPCL